MAYLSLLMLGPFQAALDGHPVAGFESCKARALLAYLATESDHPHIRSHLASLLWPSLSEPAALGNLRHALANLRRVLGDRDVASPFVALEDNCLQFNLASDHHTDVAAFTRLVEENSHVPSSIEQLECAIGLYRGDFLEGLDLDGCAEFQEWVLLRREGCSWLLMTALHHLCDHYVRACRYDEAVCCARQTVRREPWDEVAHQQLMRALALAGHRGDALRQYAECRHHLMSELQVEPSHSTTVLYERIRDGIFPDTKPDEPARQVQMGHTRRQVRTVNPSRRRVEMASMQSVEFTLDL